MRITILLSFVLSVGLLAACGGEEAEREPAIEAHEGNAAVVEGIAYRVVLFRQLNRNTNGDRALIQEVRSGEGRGLYAAFVEACNWSGEPATPTSSIVLENAFGTSYKSVRSGLEESLAYAPRRLQPEQCLPAAGTVADRTFDGAALVFEVPYDVTSERPLVLEIRAQPEAGEIARIELDL